MSAKNIDDLINNYDLKDPDIIEKYISNNKDLIDVIDIHMAPNILVAENHNKVYQEYNKMTNKNLKLINIDETNVVNRYDESFYVKY